MKLNNKIKSILKYVILAPSGYNTQPWKFKIGENFLEIIPDYTRARLNTDPEYREFFMSLGAAATNLEIAAQHFALSYQKSYRLNDQNQDYAIIYFFNDSPQKPSHSPLFKAISTRHTNRFPYQKQKISKNIILEIKSIPVPDSVNFNLITRPGDINTLASLINYSFLLWFRQQSLVEELEGWLRDDLESSPDGLPTSVINLYKLAVNLKYFVKPQDSRLSLTSQKNQNLAKNAPALAIISTKTDSVSDLFQAGQFFELLALTLASHGLATDYFNYPLFLKKTRQKTASIINSPYLPQLMFRLGSPKIVTPRTSRRPLKEMIISQNKVK